MATPEGERLRTLEIQMRQLEYADRDKESRIRSIEQTIWKAFGATSLLQIIIVIAIEVMRNINKG